MLAYAYSRKIPVQVRCHTSVSHPPSALPCKCFLLSAPSVLEKTTELAGLLTLAYLLHVAQDGENSIQLSCCRCAEILMSVTGVAFQLCSAYLRSCLLLEEFMLQIIMSANKEAVISEKDLSCRFGQEVLVGYAEPISSSNFDTFDAFVENVQREWDAQWKRVYGADFSSMDSPNFFKAILLQPVSMITHTCADICCSTCRCSKNAFMCSGSGDQD